MKWLDYNTYTEKKLFSLLNRFLKDEDIYDLYWKRVEKYCREKINFEERLFFMICRNQYVGPWNTNYEGYNFWFTKHIRYICFLFSHEELHPFFTLTLNRDIVKATMQSPILDSLPNADYYKETFEKIKAKFGY